jgi:hypothetical protein
MSASVVFASPPPALVLGDVAVASWFTGADGARGIEAGAEVGESVVAGRGGTDGARSGTGGVGATGLVELGRFVHASSSKPDATAESDLGGGTCAGEAALAGGGVGFATSGVVERAICSDAVEMAVRSTAPGAALPVLLGVGRPLLAFLSCPPGPVNRLGGPGLGVARAGVPASSPPRRLTSEDAGFAGAFGRRASMALLTRMMSPSRRPSVRRVPSVISGKIASSILSRSKEEA